MLFINLLNLISGMFFTNKGEAMIGLTRLRGGKEPVFQEVSKVKKNRDVKISDLIRGENY